MTARKLSILALAAVLGGLLLFALSSQRDHATTGQSSKLTESSDRQGQLLTPPSAESPSLAAVAESPTPSQVSSPAPSGPSLLPAAADLADQTTGPLTAPNSYTLDRATAKVTSGESAIELVKESGEFERLTLAANEQVAVNLQIPEAMPGENIFISASNGGRLLRADDGPLSFTVTAERLDLPLLFTPTLGNGSYTIDVRHAGAPLTLRFWVGGDSPAGQPGPAYVPLPPDSPEIP